MEKMVFFIHKDVGAVARGSDGVEFVSIPKFRDDAIYFFCSEYQIFWTSIEEAGLTAAGKDLKSGGRSLKPVSLKQIGDAGLLEHVDGVVERRVGATVELNRIFF